MDRLRKWWRLALFLVVLVALAQIGVSLLARTHRVHNYLLTHLERAFGRSVEVRHFTFLLLPRPVLDAEQITIGEDPSFGNEYFLRADRLTAGLRWSGLLRGHFEFGTLSLTRPSLILVRNDQGNWNLERWRAPGPALAERRDLAIRRHAGGSWRRRRNLRAPAACRGSRPLGQSVTRRSLSSLPRPGLRTARRFHTGGHRQERNSRRRRRFRSTTRRLEFRRAPACEPNPSMGLDRAL